MIKFQRGIYNEHEFIGNLENLKCTPGYTIEVGCVTCICTEHGTGLQCAKCTEGHQACDWTTYISK